MSASGYTCAARGISVSGEGLVASGDFTLYPNPAKGLINLNVETLIGAGSIVITDLYGKQVKTQNLSMGTNTVDIANLSKGMYFVSTITNEGKTTKKLVVE
jgi:phage-related protein